MRPADGVRRTHELRIHPGFEQDLQALYSASQGDPDTFEGRLVARTLHMVKGLRVGYPPTHSLTRLSDYPDLSDCETTYVGVERDEKPSHRLVWRELPPARPGGLPVREVLGIGERQYGAVYHQVGARLGRPRGLTLQELEEMPEPVGPVRERASHNPGPRGGERMQRAQPAQQQRPVDKYPQLRDNTTDEHNQQSAGNTGTTNNAKESQSWQAGL